MNPFALVDNGLVPDAAGLPSRRPRLLAVEDPPANSQSFCQVVAPGDDVCIGTGGEPATAACARGQTDLVLLHVPMHGADDHDSCHRLKADAATRDIAAIFVTARTDAADEAPGAGLGAVDFSSRPIDPNPVRARVETRPTLKAQPDLLRVACAQLYVAKSLGPAPGLRLGTGFDGSAAQHAPGSVAPARRRRAASVCDDRCRPDLANAPGEACCALPSTRTNRPHTRPFVGT